MPWPTQASVIFVFLMDVSLYGLANDLAHCRQPTAAEHGIPIIGLAEEGVGSFPHVSEEVDQANEATRATETNTKPAVEYRCDSTPTAVRRSTRERKLLVAVGIRRIKGAARKVINR